MQAFSNVRSSTYIVYYEFNAVDGTTSRWGVQFAYSGEEDDILGAAMTSDGVVGARNTASCLTSCVFQVIATER